MLERRQGGGVVVGELREAHVAWVGVAAAPARMPVADRLVVVAAQARDPGAAENLDRPVGVRTEAAEVAEAPCLVRTARGHFREHSRERPLVAVDAAEGGQP